jgi:hypothetical protein
LLRTIRLMDDTEGALSASQMPSSINFSWAKNGRMFYIEGELTFNLGVKNTYPNFPREHCGIVHFVTRNWMHNFGRCNLWLWAANHSRLCGTLEGKRKFIIGKCGIDFRNQPVS